jgi:CheY-like chemotaxis protein
MKKHIDPLGRMLLGRGIVDDDQLADVLTQQHKPLPLASMCYVLGHADEEQLARALGKQRGLPGVVLDRSILDLELLGLLPAELALQSLVLVLHADNTHVFVAVSEPLPERRLGELQFVTGKTLVPHLALKVTLARTLRAAYAARARGEERWRGPLAQGETPCMWVVSDVDELPTEALSSDRARRGPGGSDPQVRRPGSGDLGIVGGALDGTLPPPDAELDREPRSAVPDGPPRVLIVDDDFATRHLLAKLLEPAGYVCESAASGMEAVRRLKAGPPDLVIIDVMLPEINGFQICRSIKHSYKYQHIPVVLISAVIDSTQVTDELLTKYSADAYFEKPIATDRLLRKVEKLIGGRTRPQVSPDDGTFDAAVALYRRGQITEAMALLRKGLAIDPLSTRHHFVLANLLQREQQLYEAIDEYEATVHLKPDYFPALSRLAYLYYKQGFAAKAVETWRKALPHCSDPEIRRNIESVMHRLATEMRG